MLDRRLALAVEGARRSSSSRIGAFRRRARAIAIRCRCPPDSFTPRFPDLRVVGLGQPPDEVVRLRQPRRLHHLLVAGRERP